MSTSNPHEEDLITKPEEFKLYKYRFVILLTYILASTQITLMWGVFNPLQTTLQTVYNEGITIISFGTILVSNIAYIPANFVANYIIDHYGLRMGSICGTFLCTIGLWIRCLSSQGFVWIFLGQVFGGLAQPFFYNTPQKFSNVWFGIGERVYTTTFMVAVLILGTAIGSVIPQWFVNIYADNDTIMTQLRTMMIFFAILGTVCSIITVILMREKPMTPPSDAAAAEKFDLKTSLKTLLKDKNSVTMLIATSLLNGVAITYMATAQQMTAPFGFDGNSIGDVLSIAMIVSLVGSAIGAVIVQKYKKYNFVMIGSGIVSLFVLGINVLGAQSGNIYFFSLGMISYAFLIGPVQPLALEYGVELAFPVSEETIGGVWFVVNQLSSAIGGLIVDTVLGAAPSEADGRNTFYVLIGYQIISLIPLFFVKQNLKRLKYERQELDEKEEININDSGTKKTYNFAKQSAIERPL